MTPRKVTQKAQERAKRKSVQEVTLTLQASEEFLQRLGALLLFAPHVQAEYTPLTPLPWEDPDDPRYQHPPEMEVDYDAVQRTIITHLEAYVKIHGAERARDVLRVFGAERLSSVSRDQLLGLEQALREALAGGT